MRRNADNFVNYQERANEFVPGDVVVPFGMFESQAGRVTAVFPAIGMVDVEMATGSKRYPVEDVQIFRGGDAYPTHANSTAGGEAVPVSGGPISHRVALYWVAKDRKYRVSRRELSSGTYCCPRCAEEAPLKKAVYKRVGGVSEHLLGCPQCMFLIHASDMEAPDASS